MTLGDRGGDLCSQSLTKQTNRASVISQHEPDQLPFVFNGVIIHLSHQRLFCCWMTSCTSNQLTLNIVMFYVISFLAYLEHLNECSLICLWADHLSIRARLEYVWILPVNKKGLLTFGRLAEFLEMSFHVTCLAGFLSLLIPRTKIIFGTQIFNFFVCLWVCFVFCFVFLVCLWCDSG